MIEKPTTKKKRFPILLIVLLLLAVGGLLAFRYLWHKPLTKGLEKPTLAADAPALLYQQTATPFTPVDPTPLSLPFREGLGVGPASEPAAAPLCDGPQSMNILAVGIDYAGSGGDYLYGLADVIRIIHLDFSKPSISMLAVPRDLRVYIPRLESRGIDYGKINQAYFFGTPAMGYYEGQAGGAGLLADTLYYNFGFYPDHYGVVSMHALEKIINAVGGIDVTLETAVDGTARGYPLGFYDVGTHHFNGETAIMFSRIREGYSDLDRIDHQTIILNALYTKMMSEEVRPKLLSIATDFILTNKVLTDFSPSDLPMLICLAQQVDRGSIKVATLPSEAFHAETLLGSNKVDNVFYFIPDNEKIIQVFNDFKSGIWP
jgi:polyisoprenyl-teichoic acid--peptidoglycan teichoic acid transferase